ncbi:MAG: pyridoxal phosphate-dependent aminotransferase [Rhodococcus sp. (in: high G+C Gram-positive bacteria)]
MRLAALAFSERVKIRIDRGQDLIPVRGVPVLPMPQYVVDAVRDAAARPHPRATRGTPELREAIADALRTTHSMTVDPESDILVTHGAQHGMSVALRALVAPGESVIVPTPTYFFDGMIRSAGAHPKYVSTSASDGWAIDPMAIRDAVDASTRAIVLCNPNNPTGNTPTAEVLRSVLDIAEQHDLYVLSDESYERYVHSGPGYVPLRSLADSAKVATDRVVTVTSLSKNYAFTNWRVGYVHAAAPTSARIHAAFEWDAIDVGSVPQAAAVAVLSGPQEWLEVEFATMKQRRDELVRALARSGVPVETPDAGVFLLADLSASGLSGRELEESLLDHGITALSGDGFHAPAGHVRLLYGADLGSVTALGERVGAFLALREVGLLR